MTLFQSTDRQGFLVSIDLNQSELEDKLWDWIEHDHSEIFWDIEMHEGGSIRIEHDTIQFSGDNGIFTLEAVETETI
jgi:hypothetical protein